MCDCAVALGDATARGATLFGKNSDRDKLEAQPIRSLPHAEHAPGSSLRATYVEIPQARETAAVLGSGPWWCWGFEHGVNEHGVAAGNLSVFTHEELEVPEQGLLGMDLLRLGLERGRTARETLDVITDLLERFGQGGAGQLKGLRYSNGFLIADRTEAWSLQTSLRNWAAKRVQGIGSVSNHPSVAADWDLISPGAEAHAIERGWWSPDRGRFDFEAAYRSTRLVQANFSEVRQRRSSALLSEVRGAIAEPDLFRLLRDHGQGQAVPPAAEPRDDAYWTLCAHNDVSEDTTASMVAPLDRPVRWFALATPCTSVYLPLYPGVDLPAALTKGGESPQSDSAWWRFKGLQQAVERDFARRLPRVREAFDPLEAEWLADSDAQDDPEGRMEAAVARALETCDDLVRALAV